MPWSVSETPLGRRLPVQANATGGYSRMSTPNPNSGMETFKRQRQQGPTQGDPRQPANLAMLNQAADETDRADQAQYEQELKNEQQNKGVLGPIDTLGKSSMNSMRMGQNALSMWRPFLQSLKNVGAGSVRTGAAAGMQGPGFYDEQAPSIAGVMSASQMNRRNNVSGVMANYDAASYQDSRRR